MPVKVDLENAPAQEEESKEADAPAEAADPADVEVHVSSPPKNEESKEPEIEPEVPAQIHPSQVPECKDSRKGELQFCQVFTSVMIFHGRIMSMCLRHRLQSHRPVQVLAFVFQFSLALCIISVV